MTDTSQPSRLKYQVMIDLRPSDDHLLFSPDVLRLVVGDLVENQVRQLDLDGVTVERVVVLPQL